MSYNVIMAGLCGLSICFFLLHGYYSTQACVVPRHVLYTCGQLNKKCLVMDAAGLCDQYQSI